MKLSNHAKGPWKADSRSEHKYPSRSARRMPSRRLVSRKRRRQRWRGGLSTRPPILSLYEPPRLAPTMHATVASSTTVKDTNLDLGRAEGRGRRGGGRRRRRRWRRRTNRSWSINWRRPDDGAKRRERDISSRRTSLLDLALHPTSEQHRQDKTKKA